MVVDSCEGWVGAVSVGMIQCAKGGICRGKMCAERTDVVSLGLEVGVQSSVVGEREEGIDLFGISTCIGGRVCGGGGCVWWRCGRRHARWE